MEIDILTDDCISETDTVLNTPTLLRRHSSIKPVHYQVTNLEKRVQLLESEIQHYVEREIELETQLALLNQKHSNRIPPQLVEKKPPTVWQSWTGYELLNLFDQTPIEHREEADPIFLFELKSFIHNHGTQTDFCRAILHRIETWETHQDALALEEHQKRVREQTRVQRLLDALHRLLQKCKTLELDMSFILKQKQGVQELESPVYKKQIKQLEKSLLTCKEERNEFEMTLEIVRREMETMLEELEDTRQQKLRYKNQAARFKAGLEAIHRDSENEEIEAIRLLLNEAERQATDMDRECKRQTLALNGVRKELKIAEEAHLVLVKSMKQDIIDLELTRDQLTRKLQEPFSSDQLALKVALKAAKTDGVVQRARVYQLEKYHQQQWTDLNNCLDGIQDVFHQELSKRNKCIHREFIQSVERDQLVWKGKQLKEFQRQKEIDTLNAHREIRSLACQIIDLEDELERLKKRQANQTSIERHQILEECGKKIQHHLLQHQLEQAELNSNLDVLYQKNQTLKEESLILYGKNIALAHKLEKLMP